MTQQEFTIHACEQVLRFSRVANWNDLTEERKVQLGFNMGAMTLGLNLTKEEGLLALANAREGKITMANFHNHVRGLVAKYNVEISEEMVNREI